MPSYAITADLDPRLTPAREDLAASWLRDHVKAARYVEPTRQQVIAAVTSLYRSPDDKQAIDTQLLYGEPVDVFDLADGWAWIQSARDFYVGYVRQSDIGFILVRFLLRIQEQYARQRLAIFSRIAAGGKRNTTKEEW